MRIIGTDENLRPLEGKVTIISLAIFNLNFTHVRLLQSNLHYPDSLGPHKIVRIIEGPDNQK